MRRRDLFTTAALAVPSFLHAQSKPRIFAYAGCYTTEQRHGRGDGIHVFSLDSDTGILTPLQTLNEIENPSFLIASHDRRTLYSVHGDGKFATSFRIDAATGHLTRLNTGETGGVNGVHQALSRNGKFLIVANYGSGTVAVLPVAPTGELGNQIQLATLEGQPGPHRVEQASSHPHHVVFDPSGQFVLVPDKGLDRVFIFRFDQQTGRLTPTPQGSMQARAGSGPRHLAFHPTLPVVWILNELGSSVTTCSWDPVSGSLKPLQVLPSLPPDFTGESTAAEIALSPGKNFLYCSNRGHDSIARYSVNPKTGLLAHAGWTPCRGKVPRFIGFEPSGRFLYSCNQESDTITAFRANPGTGALAPVGNPLPDKSAVTIAWAVL